VKIDFEKVPNSVYNWEAFFHAPLLVAVQLSRAQRFEEAQRWFHLIFDPTTDEPPSSDPHDPSRYWRFLPFRENKQGYAIDELLTRLAYGEKMTWFTTLIDNWAEHPFRPHLIARVRLRSYQYAVVQKYVDNLIAWGDQLFRRDTIESINEATQLYVLAAKILGKRPESSPGSTTVGQLDDQLEVVAMLPAEVEILGAGDGPSGLPLASVHDRLPQPAAAPRRDRASASGPSGSR
jgi:hypothetical protein